MNNFIVSFIVPPMIKKISWGLYVFFAGWLVLGAVFVWFFVPETKNKTLEEMDEVFGSITGQKDKEAFFAVQQEVGLHRYFGRGPVEGAAELPIKSEKPETTGYVESV
jgi:hypothetical protein